MKYHFSISSSALMAYYLVFIMLFFFFISDYMATLVTFTFVVFYIYLLLVSDIFIPKHVPGEDQIISKEIPESKKAVVK
jgi:uncharacterized membrane-anchored protein YitT (DUF2179 family)